MSLLKHNTVSVIIPCFNSETSLEKSVLSAALNERVFEVLIVDDGSSDNTLVIAEKLAIEIPSKVRVYRHEDGGNHGASASRNLGLDHAAASYIAFLDADDYFLPNRFDQSLEKLVRNQSIDGVYESVGTLFESDQENFLGRIINRSEGDQIVTGIRSTVEPQNLFFALLMGTTDGHIHTNGITLRKSLIEKVGHFDCHLELHQDSHYWIRAAFHGHLEGLDPKNIVAVRKVHSRNRIKNANYKSRSKLFERLLIHLSVNNLSLKQRFFVSLRAAMFAESRKLSKKNCFLKYLELSYLTFIALTKSFRIKFFGRNLHEKSTF